MRNVPGGIAMKEQFLRNIPAISPEEQERLRSSHAVVVGCGGLGGYVIEHLARVGVGKLTVIDGDRFDVTNLNRQLLSEENSLGQYKAARAKEHVQSICRETEVQAEIVFLTEENAADLLCGADIAVDALDSGAARITLSRACRELGIPLIHGAIQGWNAQIAVCPPGSSLLDNLYAEVSPDADKSCLSFTPGLCAAIECAEAVKILLKRESSLKERLLVIDLQYMVFDTIDLK